MNKFKKFTAFAIAAAMAASVGVTAMAAPSIGQLIPEAPKTISAPAYFPDGAEIAVRNAIPEEYGNEAVAKIIAAFNDDGQALSVSDVLDALKDLEANKKEEGEGWTTTDGNGIDPEEYDAITPFIDLAIKDDDTTKLLEAELGDDEEEEAQIVTQFTLEPAKEMEQDGLAILQVNPFSGEIYFIELDEYDPETGGMEAAFPCLGPMAVLAKEQ